MIFQVGPFERDLDLHYNDRYVAAKVPLVYSGLREHLSIQVFIIQSKCFLSIER